MIFIHPATPYVCSMHGVCSLSLRQSFMSSSHSLCGLPLLFLPKLPPITPDITVTVLSFLPSPTLSTCRNRLIFRLIAFCRIVSFLSTRLNIVSFVIFCIHFTKVKTPQTARTWQMCQIVENFQLRIAKLDNDVIGSMPNYHLCRMIGEALLFFICNVVQCNVM